MDPSVPTTTITCQSSPSFAQWMSQAVGSIAVTTYQAGKVALIGWDGRQVSVLMRHFDKPMGLAVRDDLLALVTRYHVTLFANARELAAECAPQAQHDALFLPRVRYTTSDLHAHDLAFVGDDVWIVNTRFSCLATVSQRFCFEPRWQPSFITELVPEDRCHLNGLAVVDGKPRYVTLMGETNTAGGWRANRGNGGMVLDITTGATIADGLAMPHSPRWHDGKLWLLQSGTGELLHLDPATGQATAICTLPGYLRGLCLVGPFALVGLSLIREKHTFGGLPLQQRFSALRCGVAVVDLRSGQEVGFFQFTAGCEELYDVQFLPRVQRGQMLNDQHDLAWLSLPTPNGDFRMVPREHVTR